MNEERKKAAPTNEPALSLVGALAQQKAGHANGAEQGYLSASEAEMRLCTALVHRAPAGFLAVDREKAKEGGVFRVVVANPAALEATISEPATVKDLLGKPLLDLFPEVCRGEFSRALAHVLETFTASYVGEVDYREKARKVFIVHAFPLAATTVGLLLQNVTLLKQMEEAVRNSELVFRTVAETAPDAMLVFDARGGIVFANAQAERVFGYSRKRLAHERVELLVPEKGPGKGAADFLFQNRTRTRPSFEVRGRRSDGSEFPAQITLVPFETPQGLYACAAIRDVSGPRKSREAFRQTAADLAHANAQLEELASVASHDLQEPLRGVAASLQLLQRFHSDELGPEAGQQVTHALEGTKRMQLLIDALLEYSRLGVRKTPYGLVDLQEAFNAALANLKTTIEPSGALITSDPLPQVTGDLVRLSQLFQNLLANAIKFRSPKHGPRVHVSAHKNTMEWQFAVSDNGIGIDPRNLDRIFVLFQRLHGQTNYPGLGIGLAVCKKIVEQHGGRIWAESVLGSGSSFIFTLPLTP